MMSFFYPNPTGPTAGQTAAPTTFPPVNITPQQAQQLQGLKGLPPGLGGAIAPYGPGSPLGNAAGAPFYTNYPALAQFEEEADRPKPKTAKKDAAGGAGTTTATKPAAPQTPDDALTMGLGMFFQQYLAPLMQQQSQANSALIGQYGQAMTQAENNPLPPGVKSILQATTPQTQGLMQMMNQAGAQQALSAGPYQQFVQGVGADTAARQALTDAFTKLATASLYGGSTQPLSQALMSQFPQGSLESAMAGVIGQSTGINGIPGLTGVSPTTTGTTGATGTSAGSPQALTQAMWNTFSPEQQAALTANGIKPSG